MFNTFHHSNQKALLHFYRFFRPPQEAKYKICTQSHWQRWSPQWGAGSRALRDRLAGLPPHSEAFQPAPSLPSVESGRRSGGNRNPRVSDQDKRGPERRVLERLATRGVRVSAQSLLGFLQGDIFGHGVAEMVLRESGNDIDQTVLELPRL